MRFSQLPVINIFFDHFVNYPTPTNLNYFWGYGFMSGLCLIIQIISGIFLSFHYTPEINLAFNSVEHIMRDVNYGWLLRYIHSNGASFFFFILYIHIGRGLYFQSYNNTSLWYSGIILYFLIMATAFLGYVLPWGQMSFWGATVITNLFSVIPYIGSNIVLWLWGGYSLNNATLNRFFSLHYLLPFLIAGFSILHLAILHHSGSSSPLQNDTIDYIKFYPYFLIKDFFSLLILFIFLFIFISFYPNYLGHSDNYIKANSLVTPTHIVPEWYFLPFYAILRSVPNKLLGVVMMFSSILILFTCSFHIIKISRFNILFKLNFWLFIINFIILGWLGSKVIEQPYIILAQFCSFYYFYYFLLFLPLISKFSNINQEN